MKRLLLSLMMLVMITPSLACAMPICADGKEAARIEQKPCAEHHSDSQKDESKGKVRLLIDCTGVDLQVADSQADLKAPNTQPDVSVYTLTDETLLSQHDYIISKIRGPPPDQPSLSETHPSIILTTQRFRI